MGCLREQPAGEVLSPHEKRRAAAGRRNAAVGTDDARRATHSRDRSVIKRIRSWWRSGRLDRELNAEVRFHIEMETEKYVRQDMTPADARRKAFRNFGPMEKHKEETREARGLMWVDELLQD